MDTAAVLFLQLLFWIGAGTLVGYLGNQRGRHPVGWFFIGMAIPCIGLILVLVLPDLKKTKEVATKQRRENRRLREQLGQERMKSEAFRGHVTTRLDKHDGHLGIDTRSDAPSPELPPVPTPAQVPAIPETDWYLVHPGSEADGPHDLEAMRQMIAGSTIGAKTLVWHEQIGEWIPLEQSPLRTLS